MKNRKIKVNGATPSKSPKAVTYADIKDQGRIPYGKTATAPMCGDIPRKMKMRGTGAAIRGTRFTGYSTT
jgi:hypothetical protein|tara:strand:+ start:211 stop:420 length:210 start_codon:yes stop_codon:yes gene_type:complete